MTDFPSNEISPALTLPPPHAAPQLLSEGESPSQFLSYPLRHFHSGQPPVSIIGDSPAGSRALPLQAEDATPVDFDYPRGEESQLDFSDLSDDNFTVPVRQGEEQDICPAPSCSTDLSYTRSNPFSPPADSPNNTGAEENSAAFPGQNSLVVVEDLIISFNNPFPPLIDNHDDSDEDPYLHNALTEASARRFEHITNLFPPLSPSPEFGNTEMEMNLGQPPFVPILENPFPPLSPSSASSLDRNTDNQMCHYGQVTIENPFPPLSRSGSEGSSNGDIGVMGQLSSENTMNPFPRLSPPSSRELSPVMMEETDDLREPLPKLTQSNNAEHSDGGLARSPVTNTNIALTSEGNAETRRPPPGPSPG
ncbi:hypothetical protein H0H81_007135, partial [Sphagnurus paluster]